MYIYNIFYYFKNENSIPSRQFSAYLTAILQRNFFSFLNAYPLKINRHPPPPDNIWFIIFSSISAASHMPYFNSLLKNLTHCTFICFNRFCWISMSLCCIDVIRFLLSLLCNNFTFISRMLQPFFYIFINIPNQQLVLLSCKRNSHVTIFEIDCKILKKSMFSPGF